MEKEILNRIKKIPADEFYSEGLGQQMADAQDAILRLTLHWYENRKLYGESKPQPWYLKLKLGILRKIINIRHNLAEAIGGDTLHDNCGDY